MKVNFVSAFAAEWLASYRLRIAAPMRHLKCETRVSDNPVDGFDVYVFGKHAEEHQDAIRNARGLKVYDICDLHTESEHAAHYRAMIPHAGVVVCPTVSMQKALRAAYGVDAVVVNDPWEAPEHTAIEPGRRAVWFGHFSNMNSLDHVGCERELESFEIVTNLKSEHFGHIKVTGWTAEAQRNAILGANIVFLPTENTQRWRVKSPNRVLEALRYGRFVVSGPHVESYAEFAPFIWRGDIREGLHWAQSNRGRALQMVKDGQAYIRERYSPERIAEQWMGVFNDKRRADLRQETRQVAA